MPSIPRRHGPRGCKFCGFPSSVRHITTKFGVVTRMHKCTNESRVLSAIADINRATLCASAVFAVVQCPSVCPFVRPSRYTVHCIQTAEVIVKLLCRPGSPIIMVF